MNPLEEILIHAAEADVGEKGQKDGVGKLERKARKYFIDSCLHLWRSRGMHTPNTKLILEAEHIISS